MCGRKKIQFKYPTCPRKMFLLPSEQKKPHPKQQQKPHMHKINLAKKAKKPLQMPLAFGWRSTPLLEQAETCFMMYLAIITFGCPQNR